MTYSDLSDIKQTASTSSLAEGQYRLGLIALLLSYVVLQVGLTSMIPLAYDEGINLQVSQLIGLGHTPYSEIFTLSNPLFVWFIGWLGKLGTPLDGFKGIFLWFGVLNLLVTAILTRFLLGPRRALAAVFLLATSLTFLTDATAVLSVLPALGISMTALVLLIPYIRMSASIWLLLSGVIWGIGLLISNAVIVIGLVALLSIVLIHIRITSINGVPLTKSWQAAMQRIFIWLFGCLIVLSVAMYLTTPTIIFGYHLQNLATIRTNLPIDLIGNFQRIGQFLALNLFLAVFAVYGIGRLTDKANHPLWLTVIWGLLSAGWLLTQTAGGLHDTAILLSPLAILAGWGLVHIIDWLKQQYDLPKKSRSWIRWGLPMLIGYLVLNWLLLNGFLFRDIETAADLAQWQQRSDAVTFTQQQTQPSDCALSDDPTLAILANRLPPPQLATLTSARVQSGLITETDIETIAETSSCTIAIFYRRDYHRHLLSVRDWAKSYFPLRQSFENTTIFYGRN